MVNLGCAKKPNLRFTIYSLIHHSPSLVAFQLFLTKLRFLCVTNSDLLSRLHTFPKLCLCVKACRAQPTPLMTHSVTPEAPGTSAWVNSTVYESTGFRFPDSQQISAASSQLLISLLFIMGGQGAKCRGKGEMNKPVHIQPCGPEHGQTSQALSSFKRFSAIESYRLNICVPIQIHMLKPIPQCDGIKRRGLWEEIRFQCGCESRALPNGLVPS